MAGPNGLDPRDQLIEKSKCPDAPSKRKYLHSAEAWEAARHRSSESGLEIIAYACPGCGNFHLSKKVKGSDVVVPAAVGITTGALRKKSSVTFIPTERVELPPEGPIVPGNPDARRRMLEEYLDGKDGVTTNEVMLLLACSRHSVAKYMSEVGWKAERGPGAKWRPRAQLTLVPGIQSTELDEAIARHPSSRTGQDEWWAIDAFPPGVSVHDYLLTLKTAGLVVEVRVRRAP